MPWRRTRRSATWRRSPSPSARTRSSSITCATAAARPPSRPIRRGRGQAPPSPCRSTGASWGRPSGRTTSRWRRRWPGSRAWRPIPGAISGRPPCRSAAGAGRRHRSAALFLLLFLRDGFLQGVHDADDVALRLRLLLLARLGRLLRLGLLLAGDDVLQALLHRVLHHRGIPGRLQVLDELLDERHKLRLGLLLDRKSTRL